MFRVCDERDDALQAKIDKENEEAAKEGFFGRLMAWNSKSWITTAVLASLPVGAAQPVFGGFLMA